MRIKDLRIESNKIWRNLCREVQEKFETEIYIYTDNGKKSIRVEPFGTMENFSKLPEYLGISESEIYFGESTFVIDFPECYFDLQYMPYFMYKCFVDWKSSDTKTRMNRNINNDDRKKIKKVISSWNPYNYSSYNMDKIIGEPFCGSQRFGFITYSNEVNFQNLQKIIDQSDAHYVTMTTCEDGKMSIDLGIWIKIGWIIDKELFEE